MALYLRQNFVSAQYFEYQLVELHQILYMHSSWQDLSWDCYTSFFGNLYQSYKFVPELWSFFNAKILFQLNILRTN